MEHTYICYTQFRFITRLTNTHCMTIQTPFRYLSIDYMYVIFDYIIWIVLKLSRQKMFYSPVASDLKHVSSEAIPKLN